MSVVPFPDPQSGKDLPARDESDRWSSDAGETTGGKMSFLEHLDELRKRIIRSCIAVAAGMLVAFVFIEPIFNFALAPARRMLPSGSKLIYTEPGEAFSLYITLALIAGVVLATPLIMYQVWMFIAPGLYAREKKLAVPFVALTSVEALAFFR